MHHGNHRQHDEPVVESAGSIASRVDQGGMIPVPRENTCRPEGQPAAQHDTANTCCLVDSNTTISPAATHGNPAAGFQEISQGKDLEQRDCGQQRQARDYTGDTKKPLEEAGDPPPDCPRKGEQFPVRTSCRDGEIVGDIGHLASFSSLPRPLQPDRTWFLEELLILTKDPAGYL